jgi:hypothetical protein
MVLELVEAALPHLAVRLEPLVELLERIGAQPVQAPLTIRTDRHETRVPEHAEVLGHRRLTEGQPVHEDVYRLLAVAERVEEPASTRLGEDLDGGAG